MEKLPARVHGRPFFIGRSTREMEKEAKEYTEKIIPKELSCLPNKILVSIDSLPFKVRDIQNDVFANGNPIKEDFLVVTVIEGPCDFSFFSSSMSLVCYMKISVKFKIDPIEVRYPPGVYPRYQEVVYDSIKMKYYHSAGEPPPNCFKMIFSEASYPKNWLVCNGCFRSFDLTTLDFNDSFYEKQIYRKDAQEMKESFLEYFPYGGGLLAKCPHCGNRNRHFEDNHFRTLEEYRKFTP